MPGEEPQDAEGGEEFPPGEGEPQVDEFGNPVEDQGDSVPMTTKPRQEPAGSRPPDMSEMDPMETAMMANPMLQTLDPMMAQDPMMQGMGGPGGPPVEAEQPGDDAPEENPAEPSDPRAMKQSAKSTGPLPGVDLLDDENGKDNVSHAHHDEGGASQKNAPKVSTILRMVAYVQESNPSLSAEDAYDLAINALAVYDPMHYGPSGQVADGPVTQYVKDRLNPMDPKNVQRWLQPAENAVPGYDPKNLPPNPMEKAKQKIWNRVLTPQSGPDEEPEGTAT